MKLISISVTAGIGLMVSIKAAVTPVDPRCDGMVMPLASSVSPRLSWRVDLAQRGQVQSAYQILVASRADLLSEESADLWDSGKCPRGRYPSVAYAGKPLVAGAACHWKVRCWDADGGVSPWSDPARFEVAPESPPDWHGARWIDDGKANPERDEDFYQLDPAPLLRREFGIPKPVKRARLHLAGLGFVLPSLNGRRLDDTVLDPPWTTSDKRVLFRSHDVTDQLREGPNCLGLALGNGWFNPLPLRMWGQRNIRASLNIGRPRVIAALVIDHPDGTQTLVTTGPGWATTDGPAVRNSIYLGEERDARRSPDGWDRAGFDASSWRNARVTGDPLDPLEPLAMPPVRAGEAIAAKSVTTPVAGVHIVDFGRNFTGVPEIKLNAAAGTRVVFRYGELLKPDGTLNPMTSVCGQIKGTRQGADGVRIPIGGPGAPEIAWQQDVFITRGGTEERYRPDFTFHGFRFLEITGLPQAPDPDSCRGIPLHTDLADAGTFSCSDERLNRIQEMCRRTFLSNVVSVQSDCPHRERFAYGGDIVATSEAFLMNFDMSGFYAKTVRDWVDAARPDGRFTDTAPFVGIDYCGVGWAMVHPLLLEQLHIHYGNRSLIVEQFPAALRWLEGEAARRKQGLVTGGLADHEAIAKVRGPALTTPMFIDSARRVARLAEIVGDHAAAVRCNRLADESAAAWSQAFLEPTTGRIGGGTQSEQTFGLGFGAVPPPLRDAAFSRLMDDLNQPPDGPRLSTGIFGTRFLLETLSQHGRSDLALALASRKTFPSWGWMLENDATTLWEHWAGGDNTFSHNHPMFGSISAWFFRWLGGIQPAEGAIGFDQIIIRPQVVTGLQWVKCSHRSVRGLIESNWSVASPDAVDFEIVIPPDSGASVELPAKADDVITEDGRPIDGRPEITRLPSPNGVRLQIGSGRYRFRIPNPA